MDITKFTKCKICIMQLQENIHLHPTLSAWKVSRPEAPRSIIDYWDMIAIKPSMNFVLSSVLIWMMLESQLSSK